MKKDCDSVYESLKYYFDKTDDSKIIQDWEKTEYLDNENNITVDEYYKILNHPELDEFDKKARMFTYYDMLDFAEQYYKSKSK